MRLTRSTLEKKTHERKKEWQTDSKKERDNRVATFLIRNARALLTLKTKQNRIQQPPPPPPPPPRSLIFLRARKQKKVERIKASNYVASTATPNDIQRYCSRTQPITLLLLFIIIITCNNDNYI